ncbi:Di-copper centre-containing protein [Polyplosphaeria fusca]|uniref:tyrosinase n=1 Tax=Polyplosphaeria fusca TaxID=682080 RepID=A0A9P4QZW0_9PLEO|nr:Di-copper centre-containing protein [Polyplosphaeria fusca]
MKTLSTLAACAILSLLDVASAQNFKNFTDISTCGAPYVDDNPWSVVGVQGTGVWARQELRELEKDGDAWNLFLLAMARFQAMDQEDRRSYFQLSGIHGAPFTSWDGVEGEGQRGYCYHGSNMFAIWHRPYLAAFEQMLNAQAKAVAEEIADGELKKKWMEVDFHFDEWKSTVRLPVDPNSITTTSNNDEVNMRVTSQQVNNRDMVYKLLTIYQPFNEWSNKANGGKIGNLETLHDGIHNSFGIGHMGIIEVSAFDPVFWFHHCNVDRIMAIYQHRYPDTFVEASKQAKATFVVKEGDTQDKKSPLAPFHMNAKGDFWTAETSRDWESFGYTYPELVGKPSNDTLTRDINRLYKAPTQGLNTNNTLSTLNTGDKADTPSTKNSSADAIDWLAEVKMPSDIQITYAVRAFLGKPSADPSTWPTDPNYVGQVASLSSPRQDSSTIVTANIVLTAALAEKFASGDLPSLSASDVKSYLAEHFYWRIQAVNLQEIARWSPPPDLNVTVLSVPVRLPDTDDEVPVWVGEFVYHAEIKGNPESLSGNGTQQGVPFESGLPGLSLVSAVPSATSVASVASESSVVESATSAVSESSAVSSATSVLPESESAVPTGAVEGGVKTDANGHIITMVETVYATVVVGARETGAAY